MFYRTGNTVHTVKRIRYFHHVYPMILWISTGKAGKTNNGRTTWKTYSPYVTCIGSCRHLYRQLSSPVSAAVVTCIGSCRHLYRQLSSPVSAAVHVSREEGEGAGRSTAIPVTVVIDVLNYRHSQQRCGIGHSHPATQRINKIHFTTLIKLLKLF
jgi:hypothetical protein